MVKCDETLMAYKYYNKNGIHEFIDIPTFDEAAKVIFDLIKCPEFMCDSTILTSLYMTMSKLQGFSDEDIKNSMR